MWLFNPPEPGGERTWIGLQNEFPGTGDVACVPPAWKISVVFKEDADFLYAPEAEGDFLLYRVNDVTLLDPIFAGANGGLTNGEPRTATWEDDNQGTNGLKWRFAFNHVIAPDGVFRVGGSGAGGSLGILENNAAWVLWWGQAAAVPQGHPDGVDDYAVYWHVDFVGMRSLFNGLVPSVLGRGAIARKTVSLGGFTSPITGVSDEHTIEGLYDEFPDAITIEPCWP